MARIGRVERPLRASPYHHCASAPPSGAFLFRPPYPTAGIVGRWSRRPAERVLFAEAGFIRAGEGKGDGWPGKSGRTSSAFSGVQSDNYWSSTTYANDTSNAWIVNLNDGNVNNDDKTNTNYVWPVRGGE